MSVETPAVDSDPFKLAAVGNLDLLQNLVEDESFDINKKDNFDCTPLLWACHNGCENVFKYLCEKGNVDLVDVVGYGGMRPIHHSANRSFIDITNSLIDLGCDVQAKDDAGNTPLHFAAARGILKPVDALLKAGADINSVNKRGVTPLHRAVNSNHVSCVERLLKQHADPNMANEMGNVPLHLAANAGWVACAQLLIDNDASKAMKNKEGKLPADLATDLELIEILK